MEDAVTWVAALLFAVGVGIMVDGFTRRVRPEGRRSAGEVLASASAQTLAAAAGATVGAVAGFILTRWVAVGIVCGVVGALAPNAYASARAARQRLARQEALAKVTDRLRSAVKAGTDLKEALIRAADSAPPALQEEMSALREMVRLRGVKEALEGLAEMTEDPFVQRFALVLANAYQSGGRLGNLLGAVSDAAALQARTTHEIRTRQTQLRISANVLGVLPFALLIYLRGASPSFLRSYNTLQGQLVMLVGFGFVAAAWWIGRSLSRVRA
jgi:Flp pilus assembly protein TadB